nr:3-oxoacyl-[acyl-carrier-protein] synthase ii, chloroplastic [Quercus suber]
MPDVMLSGGSDVVIIPIGFGGLVACRALSQRNSDPTKASRPWDSNHDGFVVGEGAGVLLLEELEHAKRRGANIYEEFLGGSFTCDAYHITEPHPDGAGIILCVEKALAQSGVSREDVNYIYAHATSTPAGDLKEYQALLHCFGQNPELRVNSTKSMIGHLLGAAGAVEAVAAIQLNNLCLDMVIPNSRNLCFQVFLHDRQYKQGGFILMSTWKTLMKGWTKMCWLLQPCCNAQGLPLVLTGWQHLGVGE